MSNPTVQVLLSTYNGEKYVTEQVHSILNQKDVDVRILIRDDGSSDSTVEKIVQFMDDRIELVREPNIGSTPSFMRLLALAGECDYYAFADQDDVWDEDKLAIAISRIKGCTGPAIYSSNTRLVDADLNLLGVVEHHPRTDLGSALVKNYVTGCTAVFNRELVRLLRLYTPKEIPYHDWWVNLVVLANGGVSVYDVAPHMSYRQHGNNVVGAASTAWGKWKSRLRKYQRKSYQRDVMARQLLDGYGKAMPCQSKELLEKMSHYKKRKIAVMTDRRFRTESRTDDMLFWILLLTNKA